MNSLLFALITVFGWGTWLAPSQKVTFPNQQIKTLYVVAANLGIATAVALWQGSVWHLTPATFWWTFLGGMIWAVGGLSAFTATNKLGMAKAFGVWAPLNIIVSLIWGAILFDEFVNLSNETIVLLVAAVVMILVGVPLIIFAKGADNDAQKPGALRLGLAGAVGAGILWGSYFIPIKYAGVSPWAGAFPSALGMACGGVLLALLSRQSWKLASFGDAMRAGLTGVLWSVGNYGMLLLVDAIGAGKGFTISQTAVVVSALISIYWLHEPPPKTRAAGLTFIGCILTTLGGILLGNLK
ncbi:MAG TPA: GRP family sugar transporter [Anaerolineae bacterium]|nr:GRP family sugar transporter [Anaerolineae bacterium]HQI87577.1 GRP family sugar transporter [Anaerolineae bacterium]